MAWLHAARRSAVAVTLVAGCAGAVAVAATPTTASPAAASPTGPTSATHASAASGGSPSAAHPYTDPFWYPLDASAKVACVEDNPGCPTPRSYFALDLVTVDATAGKDPVFAAGAGIAHIGSSTGVCGSANAHSSAGRWVWVDHGGGVWSKYEHLATIAVSDGQLVTQQTVLGTVGSTGDTQCVRQYLDFSIGVGGINGPKAAFAENYACAADGTHLNVFPAGVSSYRSWNAVPQYSGSTGLTLPARTHACVPSPYPLTRTAPTHVAARGGTGSVTVSWSAPTGEPTVDRETITMQLFHPSTSSYGTTSYQVVKAGATSYRFSGLTSGRRYRFRVDFHSRPGNSLDSPWHGATVS